jgi:hypothetical protein
MCIRGIGDTPYRAALARQRMQAAGEATTWGRRRTRGRRHQPDLAAGPWPGRTPDGRLPSPAWGPTVDTARRRRTRGLRSGAVASPGQDRVRWASADRMTTPTRRPRPQLTTNHKAALMHIHPTRFMKSAFRSRRRRAISAPPRRPATSPNKGPPVPITRGPPRALRKSTEQARPVALVNEEDRYGPRAEKERNLLI